MQKNRRDLLLPECMIGRRKSDNIRDGRNTQACEDAWLGSWPQRERRFFFGGSLPPSSAGGSYRRFCFATFCRDPLSSIAKEFRTVHSSTRSICFCLKKPGIRLLFMTQKPMNRVDRIAPASRTDGASVLATLPVESREM